MRSCSLLIDPLRLYGRDWGEKLREKQVDGGYFSDSGPKERKRRTLPGLQISLSAEESNV